jgi:hypothetical protein
LIEFAGWISEGAGRLRLAEMAAAGDPLGQRAELKQQRSAMRRLLVQILSLN